jgi:hypothetical protein
LDLKRNRPELKDSCFDDYEYKGYKARTKLVIERHKEYKPLKFFNSHEVYLAFKKLVESDRERYYSIFLDSKNHVIGVDMISQGSLDCSPVRPREVYESAILASAARVIFVHGHLRSNPPSLDDDQYQWALLSPQGKGQSRAHPRARGRGKLMRGSFFDAHKGSIFHAH